MAHQQLVYQVKHSRLVAEDDIYDTKLIGFFSTKEHAEQVVEGYKKLVGFRDYPQDFIISEMTLDLTLCTECPSLPDHVYYLFFWKENAEDDIDFAHDIGVFSSQDRAKTAKSQLLNTGEYDTNEEQYLFIEEYEMNKCFWMEGFV